MDWFELSHHPRTVFILTMSQWTDREVFVEGHLTDDLQLNISLLVFICCVQVGNLWSTQKNHRQVL